MKKCMLYSVICVTVQLTLCFALTVHADAILPEAEDGLQKIPEAALASEENITLQFPLFSRYFTDVPVAVVNEEPVYLRELASSISSQWEEISTHETDREKAYLDILNRLLTSRLIVLEARNIGLDETDYFKSQVKEFKLKTLQKRLIKNEFRGLEPDPMDVEEIYRQISREVRLNNVTFTSAADANKFLEEVKQNDFVELAGKYIDEDKAQAEFSEQYVRIKDLLPQVARQVDSMEKGDSSPVFGTDNGFLLFQLADSRFVEDPSMREEAYKIALDTFSKKKAMEYGQALEKKYVDFNEELYSQLDFDKNLNELLNDERILATVKGEEPVNITVGDLASKVKMEFFHGADKAQSLQMLNKKKHVVITNMLFGYTSKLEAENQGLDKTDEYKRQVEAFERTTLFSAFMNRVILPEVKLKGEEVQAYYDEHLEEFSTPMMMRMNSLVFDNRENAESAMDKLLKGADFNWVSANVTGFVAPDTDGVISFDKNLLSLTALPEDLQQDAKKAKKGDTLFYAPDDEDFYYVLQMQDIFAPEPQPFDNVRNEVAKIVFNMKVEKLLDEWRTKLMEGYETKIFLYNPEG